jgi:hypothetical protein
MLEVLDGSPVSEVGGPVRGVRGSRCTRGRPGTPRPGWMGCGRYRGGRGRRRAGPPPGDAAAQWAPGPRHLRRHLGLDPAPAPAPARPPAAPRCAARGSPRHRSRPGQCPAHSPRDGVIMVTRQRLRVGATYVGKIVTVHFKDTHLGVPCDGAETFLWPGSVSPADELGGR